MAALEIMLPCPTLVLIAQSIHKTTLSFGLQVLQVPFLWQSIPDKAVIKRKAPTSGAFVFCSFSIIADGEP